MKYEQEVALIYNTESRSAFRVKSGLSREERYADVQTDRDIGVTIDIAGASDSVAYLGDYKTGWDVGPASSNDQILTAAVAWDALYGPFQTFILELIYIDQEGGVRKDRATVTRDRIAQHRHDLDTLMMTVRANPTLFVLGDHCRFCPAKRSCPRYNANIVSLEPGLAMELYQDGSALTPETVGRLWERYQQAKEAMKELERQFEGYVELNGSVPLPNGKTLKYAQTQAREYVDGEKAWKLLSKLHGEDVARSAVKPSSNKTAIQSALRAAGFDDAGVRDTMEELRQGGAFRMTKTSTVLKEV